MKDRVLLLALQIARISEEFSESEIQKAVRLLEEQGIGTSLLAYLGSRKQLGTSSKAIRKPKSLDQQRSKAVIDLEQKDPDKYEVLSEFDTLLRKGAVISSVDDIRRLGESLSKTFKAGKSRRESISRLMTLLADQSLSEIRELLRITLAASQIDKDDGDYQRLAQFIISGKLPQPTGEQAVLQPAL